MDNQFGTWHWRLSRVVVLMIVHVTLASVLQLKMIKYENLTNILSFECFLLYLKKNPQSQSPQSFRCGALQKDKYAFSLE